MVTFLSWTNIPLRNISLNKLDTSDKYSLIKLPINSIICNIGHINQCEITSTYTVKLYILQLFCGVFVQGHPILLIFIRGGGAT